MKKIILMIVILSSAYSLAGASEEEEAKGLVFCQKALFLEEGRYNLKPRKKDCLRVRYIILPGWGNLFSVELFVPYVDGRLSNQIILEHRERKLTYTDDEKLASYKVIVQREEMEFKMSNIEKLIKKCESFKPVVSPFSKGSSYIADGEDQFMTINYKKKEKSFVRVGGDPEYIEDDLKLLFNKMYEFKKKFVKESNKDGE